MDAALVKPGDIVAGKYRVDRVLGTGGMGVVFAVTHVERQVPRALKLMRAAALQDADAVERFIREARTVLSLKGEHVARVYEVGRLKTGAPYLVMEYLEGTDLESLAKTRGPLPPAEVVRYVLQICEALAEAHAQGIVHRDIKPHNLFLTRRPDRSPCVKVLDFGISKVQADDGGESTVTKSYVLLGSPHYMSPEQMRGAHEVDERADVWALGAVAYRLLTGRRPFEGPTMIDVITDVIETTPAPPSHVRPGLPEVLDAPILRCLEKDVALRWASVDELAAALRALALPTPAEAGPKTRRPSPRMAVLLVAGLLALLLIAGLARWLSS